MSAVGQVRARTKDLPPEPCGPPSRRGRGRQKGACFTRTEAVARSLVFSCTPLLWGLR